MSDGKIVSIHSFRGGDGQNQDDSQPGGAGRAGGNAWRGGYGYSCIHVLFGLDEQKMGKTLNHFLHGTASIREVGFSIGESPRRGQGRAQLKGRSLPVPVQHQGR